LNLVSENTNRRDDLGQWRRGASTLLIISVILISAVLLGYAINVKLQGSAHQNPTNAKESVVQYGQNGMHDLNNLFGNFSSMSLVYNSTTSDGSRDTMRASYNVLGVAILNGVRTFKVNVTGDETTNGQLWTSPWSRGLMLQAGVSSRHMIMRMEFWWEQGLNKRKAYFQFLQRSPGFRQLIRALLRE
jgi:hypothetical protein